MCSNIQCDSSNYININHYQMFTRVYRAEKLDTLVKLKESSKKLIYVLESIQSKSCNRDAFAKEGPPPLNSVLKPTHFENEDTISDLLSLKASKELEKQLKNIDSIEIEDEADDCTVYKKLTRKCHCLSKAEYNDFVIHFNEDTKYFTSTFGEIVKNIRILKTFLYIGGTFTNNALVFLNEGLSDNVYTNKVEIAQACAYADLCNIFDNKSIIMQCIMPNSKNNCSNIVCDNVTQRLASHLLFKIAGIEEGRRYLNFTSKITHQLRLLVKKESSKLDPATLDTLNCTINLLNQQFPQQLHAYFYKPIDTDCGVKAIESLVHYRHYMTLDEVFSQLEILRNLSYCDVTKRQIIKMLPTLLDLFKNMIVEYDNSEMNILTTSILNNIILKKLLKNDQTPNTYVAADAWTEPVKTKNGYAQVPSRIKPKNLYKSKANLKMGPSGKYNKVKVKNGLVVFNAD